MSRQWQIPGGAYINEAAVRQWQIPGGPYINDTFVSGATTMPAAAGTFTLSGKDAAFSYSGDAPALAAETATPFVLTGFAAGLKIGKKVTAATGTFVLSVAPSLSDHEHDVDKGEFSLTGIAAVLAHGHKLVAANGSFTLTGNEFVGVPSTIDPTLGAETGSFSLTGNAATLSRAAITLAAGSGSFTLTGGNIVSAFLFSVETGDFDLTGAGVTLTTGGRTRWNRRADPTTGWQRRTGRE